MQTITPRELLIAVGLTPDGPRRWGDLIDSSEPGVYIIEWPEMVGAAPINDVAIGHWLSRLPDLKMDDRRPTATELATRLASFWVPSQTIVYIGRTTRLLATRIQEYYETDLGDRRPHSGGIWLKALRGFDRALIWWATTASPAEKKRELLLKFAEVSEGAPFPFASRERPDRADPEGRRRIRKPHGLTGQRAER